MSCSAAGAVSIALAALAVHGPRSSAQPLNHPARRTLRSRRLACGPVVAGAELPPERLNSSRLFVFGFGYTTLALTRALNAESADWQVSGACTSADKAEALRAAGVDAHVWSPDDEQPLGPDGLAALAGAHYVLTSVPPVGDWDRDPVLYTHGRDIIALAAARWVGYLSSTSVYGEHGGEWVDEGSALHLPQDSDSLRSKARARAQAESGWLELHRAHGVPVHIFRLGGIYGPGRSLLEGGRRRTSLGTTDTTRARGGKRYISRCHVADIVAVLRASMAQPSPGRIYNVVDDDPAPRGEVASFAEALLAGTAPEWAPPPEPDAGAAPAAPLGEKRVSNSRIKRELGVRLRFPTYREGLRDIASAAERRTQS